MGRIPVIAGNWKMNMTVSETEKYLDSFIAKVENVKDVKVVLFPPFTSLYLMWQKLKSTNIKFGGQNMYLKEKGAFTGKVSPEMLKDVGCEYVLIGHSERRQYFFETDEIVNEKLKLALKHNLTPTVCIGETLEEREAEKTFEVIAKQIKGAFKDIIQQDMLKVIIAYEPVWAIGTGKTASPEQAEEVHAFIREQISKLYNKGVADSIIIQYGGSVKPANVKELMAKENIDGALVGGASLKPEDFEKIVKF